MGGAMKIRKQYSRFWLIALLVGGFLVAQMFVDTSRNTGAQARQAEPYGTFDGNSSDQLHYSQQNNQFQLNSTLQTLREEYARIVAKFSVLRFDCKSNMRIRVNDAIADATRWKHSVDVLGLLEEINVNDLSESEKQLIVRERFASQGLSGEALEARVRAFNLNNLGNISASESRFIRIIRLRLRGLSEQQIAEVLNGDEAIRAELRPMYDNLNRLIWDSLRHAYEKAYQCCLCSTQDFWPPMMAALFQEMSLIDEAEAVKIGSVEKNQECARAVQQRTSSGTGWRGTITYTSKYQYKGSGQKANNVSYWDEHSQYDATYRLDGRLDQNGKPLARVSATADEAKINGGRGTTACYRVSEQRYEVTGTANDDNGGITISTDTRSGQYSIYYQLVQVMGRGEHHVTSKVSGTCNNPFNKPLDQSDPLEDYPIESGPYVEIEGQINPDDPNQLDGSKTVKVRARSGERTITVTWNLLYCRK